MLWSIGNSAFRTIYTRYFRPTIKIKDFTLRIDGVNLFDRPVKDDMKTYKNTKMIATSQKDDDTTGCYYNC